MIFYKEKFRQLRESRGLTHEEIGAACGVSQSIVSRWEKKGKSQPRPAKIKKIAAILQCKESDLVKYGDTDMKKITYYIRRSGITRVELANFLQVPQPNIAAWENGSRGIPHKHFPKIAEKLNLSEEELNDLILENNDILPPENTSQIVEELALKIHDKAQERALLRKDCLKAKFIEEVKKVYRDFSEDEYREILRAIVVDDHIGAILIKAEVSRMTSNIAFLAHGNETDANF